MGARRVAPRRRRRKGAGAANLDPVIEDGDGDVAAGVGVVAVHYRVEENLAERLGGTGSRFLAKDCSPAENALREQRTVQKRHSSRTIAKALMCSWRLFDDLAGDRGSRGIDHSSACTACSRGGTSCHKSLGGLRNDAILTKPKPVKNIAELAACRSGVCVAVGSTARAFGGSLHVQVLKPHSTAGWSPTGAGCACVRAAACS